MNLNINIDVKMEVPGPCKAWLKEEYVWNIPAKNAKERQAQESAKGWRDEYKGSVDNVEYSKLCLYWDINNKHKTVSGNPISHVRLLHEDVTVRKNYQALIDFWGKHGPLFEGRLIKQSNVKVMPVSAIVNCLDFYKNIVNMSNLIKTRRNVMLVDLFMNKKRFTHNASDRFAIDLLGEPKYYRMYGNEILSEFGSFTWDDKFYYLHLKHPLPNKSEKVLEYSKMVLRENLQRILQRTIKKDTQITLGKLGRFPLIIVPKDMMAAALFSFYCEEVLSDEEYNECGCGCGEYVRGRRKYVNDDHKKKWHSNNAPKGFKDAVLGKYRMDKRNGKITQQQYNELTKYADGVLKQIKTEEYSVNEFKDILKQKLENHLDKILSKNKKSYPTLYPNPNQISEK